ncbi:hypothetical protein GT042_26050 [Streptomyces sp. SID3212]|nr:hypothetical protein [Streptomyces sp. SID3212]
MAWSGRRRSRCGTSGAWCGSGRAGRLRRAVPLPAPSRNRGSAPGPGPQAPDGLGWAPELVLTRAGAPGYSAGSLCVLAWSFSREGPLRRSTGPMDRGRYTGCVPVVPPWLS